MKIISAECYEEIEPHFHVEQSGWCKHHTLAKMVYAVRIGFHDPRKSSDGIHWVSVLVDAP